MDGGPDNSDERNRTEAPKSAGPLPAVEPGLGAPPPTPGAAPTAAAGPEAGSPGATHAVEQVPAMTLGGLASLVTVVGFLGFISIGALTQLASIPFGLWWSELFIFFAVPYVALRLSGRDAFHTPGLTRPWASGVGYGFALGCVNFFAAVAPLQFLSQKLASKELLELYDGAKVFQDKGPIELAIIVAGVCLAAPFAEEYFFRGALQRGWSSRMGPIGAVVLTGAVFSAFHLDPVGFAARWELGILFGLLALRSGSLWPGMFAHLANNLTSTCLYFALRGQPEDPSDDATALLAIAGLGGLALLGLLLLGRRFPATLRAPEPAQERLAAAPSPLLSLQWLGAGVLAFGLLLVADFRGSTLRAIDLVVPVKGADAELKDKRRAAERSELTLLEYFQARQAAKSAQGGTGGGGDVR